MIGDPERRRRLAELARTGAWDAVALLRARARRFRPEVAGPDVDAGDSGSLRRRG